MLRGRCMLLFNAHASRSCFPKWHDVLQALKHSTTRSSRAHQLEHDVLSMGATRKPHWLNELASSRSTCGTPASCTKLHVRIVSVAYTGDAFNHCLRGTHWRQLPDGPGVGQCPLHACTVRVFSIVVGSLGCMFVVCCCVHIDVFVPQLTSFSRSVEVGRCLQKWALRAARARLVACCAAAWWGRCPVQ